MRVQKFIFGMLMFLTLIFLFAQVCGIETAATNAEIWSHVVKAAVGILVILIAEIGCGFI